MTQLSNEQAKRCIDILSLSDVCSCCKGATGCDMPCYYGDQVIDEIWVECQHCKGTGYEPTL